MSQKYLIRIAELESLLRQKDQQLSLVEETEAFLRSALARAEEKIEEEEREIEHLRAQIEKLRRMLFGTRSEKLRREVEQAEAQLKQREQENDRYSGREDDPQVPRQLRQSRHRRPLPAHLPREIHRLIISEMQRKLATWAATDSSRRIERLLRLITQPERLAEAAWITLSSKGAHPPGIDGVNKSKLQARLAVELQILRNELLSGHYQPLPARRVYIPKNNGKLRPLRDRIQRLSP